MRDTAIRNRGRVLVAAYGSGVAVVAGVGALALLTDRPFAYFAREPVNAAIHNPCSGATCSYAGLLSNIGVLVWFGSAVVSFVVAYVVARSTRADEAGRAFAWIGALTALLALDDMFAVHDEVASAAIRFGEPLTYLAYALLAAALAVRFRRFFAATDYGLLLVALAMFGASVVCDRVLPGKHLIEDGTKFLGIVSWATYVVGTGLAYLRAVSHRSS